MASPVSQADTHLPSGEGSNLVATTQTVPSIPGDNASSQAGSEATTYTPASESPSYADNNLPSSQAGSQITTRSGRQNPRHSARQRALQIS